MKLKLLSLIILNVISLKIICQTEIVGLGTGTLSFANTPWANTFVTYSGTGDTRSTSPSSGYPGASGERNVFLTGNLGTTFQIDGITINNGATTATLCFGIRKNVNAADGSALSISYVNASGDNSVSLPTGTGTSTWYYVCIDLTIADSPISISFTNNSTTTNDQYRLDDISVSNSILPVKLSKFNVTAKDKNAILNWTTLSEINNSHFKIAHSTDGKKFDDIAEVAGNGNSNEETNYEIVHENPANGINYYQLTQYDFDGKSESFKIETVRIDGNNDIKIFPYNITDRLYVEGKLTQPLEIYDSSGKKIGFYENTNSIDMSNYSTGLYLIKIGTEITKVFKN